MSVYTNVLAAGGFVHYVPSEQAESLVCRLGLSNNISITNHTLEPHLRLI